MLASFSNYFKLRKTWLHIAISVTTALLFMMLFYVHWQPKTEVLLQFKPSDESNVESLGTEFRIFYIMVDDQYLPLKSYVEEVDGWMYDGTIVAYGNQDSLTFSVQANRVIEVSMKKGPWMGSGVVSVGDQHMTCDFYSKDDYGQQLINIPMHHFINLRTSMIGLFVFAFCFILLQLLTRHIKVGLYWNGSLNLSDFIVISTIVILSILFCIIYTSRPGAKVLYSTMDEGMYLAGANKILNGFAPYLQHYEEKGPITLLLFAAGELLWFPYGIWILSTALFIIGMIFLTLTMRQLFSKFVTLMAVVFTLLLCNAYNAGGINTEILSIPFMCISLYVFVSCLTEKRVKSIWLIICGACFAVTLLMRVSNAWLWVVGVPMILYAKVKDRRFAESWRSLLYMGAGVGIIVMPILAWLASCGAINEWLFTTVGYAGLYIKDISVNAKIFNGFTMLNKTELQYWYLIPVITIACDIYLSQCIKQQNEVDRRQKRLVKLFVYVAGAFGFYCAVLNGYTWVHAILILLPIWGILGAYFIENLSACFGKSTVPTKLILFILLVAVGSNAFTTMAQGMRPFKAYFSKAALQMLRISNYINSSDNTDNTDVAIYASKGDLGSMIQNTSSERSIATYAYLSTIDSLYDAHIERYMDELRENPRFVAYDSRRARQDEATDYIHENYTLIIEGGDYSLYEHTTYAGHESEEN